MNNHNFSEVLSQYQSKMLELAALKRTPGVSAHRLHIATREVEQLKKRVDTYGTASRLNLRDLYLVHGKYLPYLYSIEQVHYYSPAKFFQIYFIGIYPEDLKILLPFKLNGPVEEYEIIKLDLAQPII